MKEFFECGIFTEFIETKYSYSEDKWIKFFDRARRKVLKVQMNEMIQEESDFVESEEEEDEKMPKGCLSLINMFSKES